MRNHFPLLKKSSVVYLDSAATTQKPQSVLDRLQQYYAEENANIHRSAHLLAQKATMAFEDARSKVAKFINAESQEIIFTSGTTAGLNHLARSLATNLKKGDEIVLSVMEHHANLVPWQQVAAETGAVLKFASLRDGKLDFTDLITENTKIVSLVHMSNVLGTVNDVTSLAEKIHAVDGILIVDGAQSIVHQPIDVKKLDCDFFVFSGHKLYGPTGIGIVYGKKQHLDTMEPFFYGGEMINTVTLQKSTWAETPSKFEAGTPPIAQAIGLGAAVDFVSEHREEMIQIEQEVHDYALEKLSSLAHITLYGKENGIFSFTVEGMDAHDAAMLLDAKGIAVRSGTHCAMPLLAELGVKGLVRASFAAYNTKEDVDALYTALTEIKRT